MKVSERNKFSKEYRHLIPAGASACWPGNTNIFQVYFWQNDNIVLKNYEIVYGRPVRCTVQVWHNNVMLSESLEELTTTNN